MNLILRCRAVGQGTLALNFIRSFGPREMQEWGDFSEMVGSLHLGEDPDVGFWALNRNGEYTAKSLYLEILNPGVKDTRILELLATNIPLKIKNFIWMCFKGRIQVTVDLKAKQWPGELGCVLCGEEETASHLLFSCPLAHFSWWCLKDTFGWKHPPESFQDFFEVALKQPGVASNRKGWAILGAMAWATWTSRNDMVFNRKFCSSSLTNIYKTISNLSQWRVLLSEERRADWDTALEKLKLNTRRLQLMMPRRGVG